MSGIAQELDETLQRIDPGVAERITCLVREILLLAKTRDESNRLMANEQAGATQLLDLAAHAEPMGVLTNVGIDQAVYGR